jgi:choline dehydrogenase
VSCRPSILYVEPVTLEPLPPFSNHLPIRVRFGDGVAAELPAVVERLGARRPLVLVDPALVGSPRVAALLPAAATVRAVEPGEPTIESVDAAGHMVADHDALVAIGGGSTLDTAKGARLVATAGASIRRFAWPGEAAPAPPPKVPLVTVPTTAGTGSEVTGGIVMLDGAGGVKVGAASPHNRAQDCLVDPVLTHTLPPLATLFGGLDVLAQAVGAIVARTNTPVGDGIALEALALVRDALPAVAADGADAGARNRIACASLLAGFAMNLSEAGTDHSLGHALGARHGIPHGLSVGVMLAESMEHDRLYVPERMERIADALGAPAGGSGDGSRAVSAVRSLLARVGCPVLRDLGVGPADVAALADTALAAWIPVEPGPWARANVEEAYRRALSLETRGATIPEVNNRA